LRVLKENVYNLTIFVWIIIELMNIASEVEQLPIFRHDVLPPRSTMRTKSSVVYRAARKLLTT
jgi:hypothetical protein